MMRTCKFYTSFTDNSLLSDKSAVFKKKNVFNVNDEENPKKKRRIMEFFRKYIKFLLADQFCGVYFIAHNRLV